MNDEFKWKINKIENEVNELKRSVDLHCMNNIINDIKELKSRVFDIKEELNNLQNSFYELRDNKNKESLVSLYDLIPLVFIYVSLFFILLYEVFKENNKGDYLAVILIMIIVYILFKALKNEEK